jgi:hypothetical protein
MAMGETMTIYELRVDEFAEKLSEALARQGLTPDDLIADGEALRQALFEERYGDLAE